MRAPLVPIERFAMWLDHGERGISSETIVSALSGVDMPTGRWGMHAPLDPADFRRCELLLRAVPEARQHLSAMAKVSPKWAALVKRWQEIVDLIEEEIPGAFESRHPRGGAPKAYLLMKQIAADAAGDPR